MHFIELFYLVILRVAISVEMPKFNKVLVYIILLYSYIFKKLLELTKISLDIKESVSQEIK